MNIIHGCAVEAGIECDFEKNKSVIPYPYIYGSPLHLRQIFLNIYGNCIKYNRPDAKTIPIIAMTANAFAEDAKKCFDGGMNAHIAKPINMDTLKNTLG